jgi:hypothetical protein
MAASQTQSAARKSSPTARQTSPARCTSRFQVLRKSTIPLDYEVFATDKDLIHFPNAQNPLYGGRDQFLPTDFPQPKDQIMSTKQAALGILETQGLTAILEVPDTMLKSANVTLVGEE